MVGVLHINKDPERRYYSRAELARQFGVTVDAVSYHARKLGINGIPRKKKHYSLSEIEALKKSLKLGNE